MKAKTHPSDEQKVKTSSDHKTMDSEEREQPETNARGKADSRLEQTGLTVDEIAEQSSYERDEHDISNMAANSDRNKKVTKI
jgi:hypothetical protein